MNFQKIAEWMYSTFPKVVFPSGRALPPVALNLLLTYACDLQCQTCFYHNAKSRPGSLKKIAQRKPEQLTLEEYYALLEDAKRSGVRFVTLHGGEPTIHPYFDQLMDKISELGMKASFVTNGFNTIKKLDTILKSKIRNINVSIDGYEELQDFIRGKEGLYRRQLELFSKLKEHGIKFSAGIYISGLNYDKLFDIFVQLLNLNIFQSLDFGLISYLSDEDEQKSREIFKRWEMYDENEEIGSLDLEPHIKQVDLKVFEEQKQKVIDYIREHDVKVPVLFPGDKETDEHFTENYDLKGKHCTYFYTRMVITPYGEVTPCVNLGMLGMTTGNIRGSSIKKEWNSPAFRKARKMLNKRLLPACNRCCVLLNHEYLNK